MQQAPFIVIRTTNKWQATETEASYIRTFDCTYRKCSLDYICIFNHESHCMQSIARKCSIHCVYSEMCSLLQPVRIWLNVKLLQEKGVPTKVPEVSGRCKRCEGSREASTCLSVHCPDSGSKSDHFDVS